MSRHGTTAGWHQHQTDGERPCDPCHQAKSDYDKRYRSAPERTRLSRMHAKAQQRALKRLKDMAPEVYSRLYREEKAALLDAHYAEGGAS